MGVGGGLCALAALMDEMATPETLVKYKSQSLSFFFSSDSSLRGTRTVVASVI